MLFISSRNSSTSYTFAEAAMQGRDPQGGIFLPQSLPELSLEEIYSLGHLDFPEAMARALSLFLGAEQSDGLTGICQRAFDPATFGDKAFAVQALNPYKPVDLVVFAEQGPSGSRHDYANALARELYMSWGLEENTYIYAGPTPDAVISLAASLPHDLPYKTLYFIDQRFKPEQVKKLSSFLEESRAQGIYLDVKATESFQLYRDILQEEKLQDLKAQGELHLLPADGSSVISLVCQMALLALALAKLKVQDLLPEEGLDLALASDDLDFVLAFFYLKSLGLPLKRCLIAENSNRLFSNFFRSGRYNLTRRFQYSVVQNLNSPWPPSFEALLFELFGRNQDMLADFLAELVQDGHYQFPRTLTRSWQAHVKAIFNNDKSIVASARSLYDRSDYLLDGGAAAGFAALQMEYKHRAAGEPALVLSSQSPLWSLQAAGEALFSHRSLRRKGQEELLTEIVEESGIPVPPALASIYNCEKLLVQEEETLVPTEETPKPKQVPKEEYDSQIFSKFDYDDIKEQSSVLEI